MSASVRAMREPRRLAELPYDGDALVAGAAVAVERFAMSHPSRRLMLLALRELRELLDGLDGDTLQGRFRAFERDVWPGWVEGVGRPRRHRWTLGVAALVLVGAVRPGWPLVSRVRIAQWIKWLPADDPLLGEAARLERAIARLDWIGAFTAGQARALGIRVLPVSGKRSLGEIAEQDLLAIPAFAGIGLDALDAALCDLGVFKRTPQRGSTRRNRARRLSPAELVERSSIPERFRAVTVLYLEAYAQRISDVYSTLRAKKRAIEHFWLFIDERQPELGGCAEVRPEHARAFVPFAIEQARRLQRSRPTVGTQDRTTAHAWLIDVRRFCADLCAWATEPGSPFGEHAPPVVPLQRRDLVGVGFEKARRRQEARTAATVLDLEREVPKIRAHALRRWHHAQQTLAEQPRDRDCERREAGAFWDWALLELLVQSGLRIEEACELTALDVLKRKLPDRRVYYLLHIKPSKLDQARVIPIGDGLGKVIAEIVRHIRRFHSTDQVPACESWDVHEKRPRPRAPYLLQGLGHPSAISPGTIRAHLAALSRAAGARKADGSPLLVRPHDCRRIFASEHLNNNTPVHVIQALLGHATLDTVMVYAKLYPSKLIEEYRKAVRGTYHAHHGEDALRNPTPEEWTAFERNCSLRDMGTHLCALPTGEHCPKGLVCLGCVHAQPKKSAAPTFRHMLTSHRNALTRARQTGEPAGQLAARELEVQRIEGALRRADDLNQDVAQAIETAAT